MSGATLEYSGFLAAEGWLNRLKDALGDLTPLMERIGAELETSADRRFETKTAPDGSPWAKLAASTIRSRLRAGSAPNDILVRQGRLRRSLHAAAGPDSVVISLGGSGDSTAYAAIHQFGGTIRRAARSQTLYYKIGRYEANSHKFAKKKEANYSETWDVAAHAINIPARPVLGVSGEDERALAEIVENYFLKLNYGEK